MPRKAKGQRSPRGEQQLQLSKSPKEYSKSMSPGRLARERRVAAAAASQAAQELQQERQVDIDGPSQALKQSVDDPPGVLERRVKALSASQPAAGSPAGGELPTPVFTITKLLEAEKVTGGITEPSAETLQESQQLFPPDQAQGVVEGTAAHRREHQQIVPKVETSVSAWLEATKETDTQAKEQTQQAAAWLQLAKQTLTAGEELSRHDDHSTSTNQMPQQRDQTADAPEAQDRPSPSARSARLLEKMKKFPFGGRDSPAQHGSAAPVAANKSAKQRATEQTAAAEALGRQLSLMQEATLRLCSVSLEHLTTATENLQEARAQYAAATKASKAERDQEDARRTEIVYQFQMKDLHDKVDLAMQQILGVKEHATTMYYSLQDAIQVQHTLIKEGPAQELREECARLAAEQEKVAIERANMQRVREMVDEEVAMVEEERAAVDRERDALRADRLVVGREREALAAELAASSGERELRASIDALQGHVSQLEKERDCLCQDKRALEARENAMNTQLKADQREREVQEQALNSALATLTKTEAELRQAQETRAVLMDQVAALRKQINENTSEAEAREKAAAQQAHDMQMAVRTAEAAGADMTAQIEDLQQQVNDANARFKQQLAVVESSLSVEKERGDEARHSAEDAHRAAETTAIRVRELENSLSNAEGRCVALEGEKQELTDRMHGMTQDRANELSKMTDLMQGRADQVQKLSDERVRLQEELEKSEELLGAAQQELVILKADLQARNDELVRLSAAQKERDELKTEGDGEGRMLSSEFQRRLDREASMTAAAEQSRWLELQVRLLEGRQACQNAEPEGWRTTDEETVGIDLDHDEDDVMLEWQQLANADQLVDATVRRIGSLVHNLVREVHRTRVDTGRVVTELDLLASHLKQTHLDLCFVRQDIERKAVGGITLTPGGTTTNMGAKPPPLPLPEDRGRPPLPRPGRTGEAASDGSLTPRTLADSLSEGMHVLTPRGARALSNSVTHTLSGLSIMSPRAEGGLDTQARKWADMIQCILERQSLHLAPDVCSELQGTGGNDGETDQDSCSSASDIEESSQEGRGAEIDAGASPRTMALNWLQEPLAQVTREQLAQAAKEFASESLAAAEAEGQGETDDESQDSEDEEGWTLEEKVESAAEQEARAARVRAEKLHAQLCQSEDRSAGARDRLNAAASPKDSLRTADDRATQVTGLRLTGRRGQCIFPTSPPLATQEPLAVSPSDLTVPSPALSGALSSVGSILSSNLGSNLTANLSALLENLPSHPAGRGAWEEGVSRRKDKVPAFACCGPETIRENYDTEPASEDEQDGQLSDQGDEDANDASVTTVAATRPRPPRPPRPPRLWDDEDAYDELSVLPGSASRSSPQKSARSRLSVSSSEGEDGAWA